MKFKKATVIFSAAVLSLSIFSGCSGDGGNKDRNPAIVVSSTLVNDAKAEDLKNQLKEALPDMEIDFINISVGDTSKDPASAMAGIMKLTTTVAGKEADVLIADYDTAKRNAGQEIFYSLTELFSEEELSAYQDRIISFELTDTEGNSTGEKAENCGIDVSDNEAISALCPGADSVGVYVISNSTRPEDAKKIFMQLLEQ